MSVLINMEMPTSCEDCVLLDEEHSKCKLHDNGFRTWNEEYAHCPLVPVPPHGRLIDADALIIDLMDRGIEGVQTDDWHEIQQAVMDAPTIIPAEEGE